MLFSDSSQKAAQFIQLCNQTGTPLVFLQHITGYMVGRDYERGGIVKHGSQMINALSNSTVPHVTVILGASYGAGNYGMGGRAFDTRFVFLWPTAKIAIMGPKQMAGVMSIVRRERAARRGEAVSEETEAAITAGGGALRRGRIAGPVRHRPGRRRRHHRPPRHPDGARHGAVRVPQRPGAGCPRVRGVPAVITTLLVANRGEIARRIVSDRRRDGDRHGRGVRRRATPGRRSSREADRAVALPGRTAAETYLNIDALLARGRRRRGRRRASRATASCPSGPASPGR